MAKKNKKNGTFYPIPAERDHLVSFSAPDVEGYEPKDSIRKCRARRRLLSKEKTCAATLTLYNQKIDTKKKKTLPLKKIAKAYAPNSYVCMANLKDMKLLAEDVTYLRIKAKGKLDRPLLVEANEFNEKAVRMLTLTGGRAVLLK